MHLGKKRQQGNWINARTRPLDNVIHIGLCMLGYKTGPGAEDSDCILGYTPNHRRLLYCQNVFLRNCFVSICKELWKLAHKLLRNSSKQDVVKYDGITFIITFHLTWRFEVSRTIFWDHPLTCTRRTFSASSVGNKKKALKNGQNTLDRRRRRCPLSHAQLLACLLVKMTRTLCRSPVTGRDGVIN